MSLVGIQVILDLKIESWPRSNSWTQVQIHITEYKLVDSVTESPNHQ